MSLLTSTNLHRLAAALYCIVAPGHVWMGYQKVYPALAHIPSNKFNSYSGRISARLAWDLVTTAVIVAAAMHWKWARTGASDSMEENLAVFALTGHVLWNGIQYLRIGEAQAGPLLTVASSVGLIACASHLL